MNGERWRDTTLWTELLGRDEEPAARLRGIIEDVLPDAEKVLNSGSGPANFTLHDADHAWRVAEGIVSLVEVRKGLLGELGPHDLAMLLLSAFLHDIGMAPPLSRIQNHYDVLLSGNRDLLDKADRECLQAWLDDEWDGKVPPIVSPEPTIDELRSVRLVLAGYIRHRHNDWSGEWIAEKLNGFADREYPGWVDDVVLLCRSHHFSIDQLKADSFSPRLVGNPGTVLHLRYCACLLRVADVLDFDPERTPPILFAHRGIDEGSAIYWHKDHELGFDQTGPAISIHAQPRDAVTHHAIVLTIEDVDRELVGSRRVADETQFHRMTGRDEDLPHHWELETSVRAKVVPREGAYEYIDGTFRPDATKLLEMVGGVELYGSPMASVRELLQNAFDAVRDQIARQRLRQEDPASDEVRDLLARTHSVNLTLEQTESGLRLKCRDTGSGMSREIIKSRLLVGGKKASHEMRSLERLCEDHGFSTGKTARFGIGVLSYFLIASEMEVQTRRSIEADDPDGTGWRFKIGGLEDFGELKRADGAQVGTEVTLTIKQDLPGETLELARQLRAYVEETIRRVPCRFTFSAPGLPVEPFETDLGWVDREQEVRHRIAKLLVTRGSGQGPDTELLSAEVRESRAKTSEFWSQIHDEIIESLVLEEEQGEMPDGLGFWRIFYGHFDLCGHPLASFLRLTEGEEGFEAERLGESLGLYLGGSLEMGWNGMTVEADDKVRDFPRTTPGVVVEIDWCNDGAGWLAVSRNSFRFSQAAVDGVTALRALIAERQQEFVREEESSPFYLLNARVLNTPVGKEGSREWMLFGQRSARAKFTTLKPPLIDPQITIDRPDVGGLRWRGLQVTEVPQVSMHSGRYLRMDLRWCQTDAAPGYVAAISRSGEIGIVPVWDRLDRSAPAGSFRPGSDVQFPDEWNHLVGATIEAGGSSDSVLVWNASHPLVKACTAEAWLWAAASLSPKQDPLALRSLIEEDPARAAAMVLYFVTYREGLIWNGMVDREPAFLADIWAAVNGLAEREEVCYWRGTTGRGELHVIDPNAWRNLNLWSDKDEVSRLIPPPGGDWWLEEG